MRSRWRGEVRGTLRDLGEIAWGVLLLLGVVAGLGWLSRAYFGPLAWRVTLGLGAVVLIVFTTIVLANLAAVVLVDAVRVLRDRRDRSGR
jgi:hypothetical protein